MKRFLLYTILLLIPFLSQSQQPEWFPVGAEWHYKKWYATSGDVDYNRAQVTADTVKNGISCKKLAWKYDFSCYSGGVGNYVYADSNKVYFYNTTADSFNVLYDFSAQVGDTWEIPALSSNGVARDTSNIVFQVDSTDSVMVNGHNLKVLYIHDTVARSLFPQHNQYIGFRDELKVIEYIGCTYTFFPWQFDFQSVCDISYTSPLRCYNAPGLGMYKAPNFSAPCDTTWEWTSVRQTDANQQAEISIMPHPVNNRSVIRISTSKTHLRTDITCTIYDPLGREMQQLPPSPSPNSKEMRFALNASSLEGGVYLYRVRHEGKEMASGKVVVE